MNRRARTLAPLGVLLGIAATTLGACGDSNDLDRDLPTTAESSAQTVKQAVPTITKLDHFVENEDSNGFQEGTVLFDSRLPCSTAGVECGAVIEQWADQESARERAQRLQAEQGSEYDIVRGRLLLRVSGDLAQADVEAYRTAFVGKARPEGTTSFSPDDLG